MHCRIEKATFAASHKSNEWVLCFIPLQIFIQRLQYKIVPQYSSAVHFQTNRWPSSLPQAEINTGKFIWFIHPYRVLETHSTMANGPLIDQSQSIDYVLFIPEYVLKYGEFSLSINIIRAIVLCMSYSPLQSY